MDVEGTEWQTLKTMYRDGSLKFVKQLVFEAHGMSRWALRAKLRYISQVLKLIEKAGFRRFHTRANHFNRYLSKTGRRFTSCYEFSYINLNFLSAPKNDSSLVTPHN